MSPPYKLFTIYAREDAPYLDELRGHLAPLQRAGRIRVWSDREINPGVDWEREIVQNLDSADIILILVSAAYFNSAYIHEVEIKRALARHEKGEARVLPIILRPCAFGDDPVISRLQALPADAKPVSSRAHWPERDDAWLDVVEGLKRTLDSLQEVEKRREQDARKVTERQQRFTEQKKAEEERKRQAEKADRERQEKEDEDTYRRELLERRIQKERDIQNANAKISRQIREVRANQHANSKPLLYCRHYFTYGGMLLLLLAVWLLPKILYPDLHMPEMILIKGGTFDMGDIFGDGAEQEKPAHQVTLSDFYLGKTEVTFDEYDAYCTVTGRKKPDDDVGGRGKRPVINVSWFDAVEYCNWLSEKQNLTKAYNINGNKVAVDWTANGYRLPTEAEWEYAARSGGKKEKWAGTSIESTLYLFANFCDKNCGYNWKIVSQNDGYVSTAPVGGFQSNGVGLYDMSGNVSEWCWDFYYNYPSGAQTDPAGPDQGLYRVSRGGSWIAMPGLVRCADRYYLHPGYRNYYLGFRLARSAKF